jgi:hypothetical protein
MELTAYHKWLLEHCHRDTDLLALQLAHDATEKNPQAFTLLETAGVKVYNRAGFYMAAIYLLKQERTNYVKSNM